MFQQLDAIINQVQSTHDIIYFDRFFCEWIDAASKSMRTGN